MTADGGRFLARLLARLRPATPRWDAPTPPLPLLEHLREPGAADWLHASMTTFAESVASFLPGHFEAYARIHHPFDDARAGTPRSWRELLSAAGAELHDPAAAEAFAYGGWEGGQATVGRLPPLLLGPLLEHLERATTAADRCFFAVWEGHGDSVVGSTLEPTLELPHRRHHVFAGPIEGARTSFSVVDFYHLSANLWWPADRAWCVATEIDAAWTYVGGARRLIDALLADPRLEAVETTAAARW
jgi:hypothetical protein